MKNIFRIFLIGVQSLGLSVSLGLNSWHKIFTRVTLRTAVSEGNCICLKSVLQRALPTINHFPRNPKRLEFPVANVSGGYLLSPYGHCLALTDASEHLLPTPLLPYPPYASDLLVVEYLFSAPSRVMNNGRKTYQTWRGVEISSLLGVSVVFLRDTRLSSI